MFYLPDKIELRKESNAKKKRKSRTAFTNTQIFELEKRFIYQKYLSPADRDEISCKLGISGGQVSAHPIQGICLISNIFIMIGSKTLSEILD